MKIGINKSSCGLGDILTLTAICRENSNCIVELPPQAKRFKCLFDNICEKVIITNNPIVTKHVGSGTFIEGKLRACNLPTNNPLPYIKLNNDEKKEAKKLIKKYKNPLIFVPNCSKKWKRIREMNRKKWEPILNELNKKYTILQFGVKNNFTPFDQAIHFVDTPLKTQMQYFYGIGKYLGVDTGDRHLAIALNCKTVILHPSHTTDYKHNRWRFIDEKIKYVNFNEVNNLSIKTLFDFYEKK